MRCILRICYLKMWYKRQGWKSLLFIKPRVQNPRRVTKPYSNASTHAQTVCAWAWSIAISVSSRARHVKHHVLLSLEPISFSTTAAYSFIFAFWGAIIFPLYVRPFFWFSQYPQRWPRIAVKGIYCHNF